MMMTPSIDLTLSSIAVPAGETPSVLDSVPPPLPSEAGVAVVVPLSSESGLRELVTDNAALGAALQTVVESLDRSPVSDKKGPEKLPVAIDTGRAVDSERVVSPLANLPSPVDAIVPIASSKEDSSDRNAIVPIAIARDDFFECDAKVPVASPNSPSPVDAIVPIASAKEVVFDHDAMGTIASTVTASTVSASTGSEKPPVAVESERVVSPLANPPSAVDAIVPIASSKEVVSDHDAMGTIASTVSASTVIASTGSEKPPVAVDSERVVSPLANPSSPVDAIVPIASAKEVVSNYDTMGTIASMVTASTDGTPPRLAAASKDSESSSQPETLAALPVEALPVMMNSVPQSAPRVDSVSPVAPVASVDGAEMFLAAAEAVASAVRVSPELRRGEPGELRIQLRPDVLAGAEVVVAVDGKKMDVTFVPTVPEVAQAIQTNQAVLQQQLSARIASFEVSVGVAQVVAAQSAPQVARARRVNGRA